MGAEDRTEDAEVVEPENSTVDDWFGQNVARDQDVADRVSEEAGSAEEAESRFEDEADGKARYDEGHPRPDGGGDAGAGS